MTWNRKHLLDIESSRPRKSSPSSTRRELSRRSANARSKRFRHCAAKTVVNLFIEPSTRTRISFELAEQRLTADIINFTAEASSLKKGETLKDTARNLEALNADIIIIRHSATWRAAFSLALPESAA